MRANAFGCQSSVIDAPTERASRTSVESVDTADKSLHEPGPILFQWGPLRVLERVGEGSGGEVYRAYDPALQTEVALKLKRPDAAWSARFLEEARMLARVRHTNVLAIHGADEHDGRTGIWTDFIRGCTLEEYIRSQGPLSACEATTIGLDLCRALAAVHGRRLVHRDIKASNVMRELGGRTLLTDFGCVGELSSTGEAESGGLTGTPLAMAPEQLRGEPASVRSDIYALGALLYRLVTCRYPVEGSCVAQLLELQERRAGTPLRDHRPDLPVEFVHVVERALEPDADRRYPTAGAMEQALRASIGGTSLTAAPDRFRLARRAVMLGAGLILGVAAATWVWSRLATHELDPMGPRAQSHRSLQVGAGAGALSEPPAHAAVPPLEAKAVLYRHTGTRDQLLASGAAVRPGDRLFLELSIRQPMHAYVLNEDEAGAIYTLFPIPGVSPINPLSAIVPHRLPGRMGDSLAYWTVTSVGGREGIVVIGSRTPLRELEQVIARVPMADPGRAVRWDPGRLRRPGDLRSIGGIHKERAAARDTHRLLHQAVQALEERGRESGDIWVWRMELNNFAR